MVNPGGTGRPAFVISARPAPLPPRSSFILPLPSALPPPNEYTYLVAGFVLLDGTSVSGIVIVAMSAFPFFMMSFRTPSGVRNPHFNQFRDEMLLPSLRGSLA